MEWWSGGVVGISGDADVAKASIFAGPAVDRTADGLGGQGLVAEEVNPNKCLILAGGGAILPRHDSEKRFQFMLTWPMPRQPFEEVATPPEPDAVMALCGGARCLRQTTCGSRRTAGRVFSWG